MTASVFQRDRGRFYALLFAYVASAMVAVAAVLLLWLAVVRPPAVVILDGEQHARLVRHTVPPPVTASYVQAFSRRFAEAVAVDDWLTGPKKRDQALAMMSVPLARYERSETQRAQAVVRQADLKEQKVSGHLMSADSQCLSSQPSHWVCVVRGQAGYRLGPSTALAKRKFVVQMQVEALPVTTRSPYGLLVNAFHVTHQTPGDAPPATDSTAPAAEASP